MLDMDEGVKFVVNAIVSPTDGEVIQVRNLPFVSKTTLGNSQHQYQPKFQDRPKLGIASRFSIIESDYEILRHNGTITLLRPRSGFTMKLTLVRPE
jgi:hypothetical protein